MCLWYECCIHHVKKQNCEEMMDSAFRERHYMVLILSKQGHADLRPTGSDGDEEPLYEPGSTVRNRIERIVREVQMRIMRSLLPIYHTTDNPRSSTLHRTSMDMYSYHLTAVIAFRSSKSEPGRFVVLYQPYRAPRRVPPHLATVSGASIRPASIIPGSFYALSPPLYA